MKTLTVSIPKPAFGGLQGQSVMLFKATHQDLSVACVLYNVVTTLPTKLEFGPIYAYATPIRPPFKSCQIVASASDRPLNPHAMVSFDGAEFTDAGQVSEDFLFGLRNDQPGLPLSCGLAQDIAVNELHQVVPTDLYDLGVGSTVYFPPEEEYWIGVGRLAGIEPRAGVLLPTPILTSAAKREVSCIPILGRFKLVSFAERDDWIAEYDIATNAFEVRRT